MLQVLGATRTNPEVVLTAMQRTMLAAIALSHPHPVSVSTLSERVWPHDVPTSSKAALQNQISRLRSALPVPALETTPDGYRWVGRLDIVRLRDGVRRAETVLAAEEHGRAFTITNQILGDITGEAFEDLPDSDEVIAAREETHLHRYALENLRLSAAVADGAREWAAIEAERLAREFPYDEQRHALHAKALAHVGRRPEALRVIASFRRRVRDELGLGTTELLADAEQTILHAGHETARGHGSGETVGRRAELARTLDLLTGDQNVCVTGEPGVGVSSFLTEVSTSLSRRDWKIAFVHHTPMIDAAPLEVLSEVLALLAAPPVESWELLPSFARLVNTARNGKRLLLIVDDADLLGPSTLRGLHEATEVPGIVLLTGTHAPPSPDTGAVVMRLSGLDDADIAQLARSTYHQELSASEVGQLQRSTAGNSLLLHALLRTGHISRTDPATDPLRDAVHRRLARLSPAARTALDWVAVSAGTIPADLLIDAHPEITLLSTEDPELIEPQTTIFRHDAIRGVVYDEIPEAHRSELHHTLAILAKQHALPHRVIATHAIPAGMIDPDAAAESAYRAAQDSTGVGAHLDAAEVLGRALSILPNELPEHLGLRIAQGDALRLAGDPAHLPLLHDAATEALGQQQPKRLAAAMFALLQLGATSVVGQIDDRTLTLTQQALSTLQEPEDIALVSGAASLSLSMSGQAEESLAAFHRAERLATSRATRDAILPFAYLALGHPDHREHRARLTEELIHSGRTENHPRALWEGLHQRFSAHALGGSQAGMATAHEEMVTLMPRLGDVGRAWSIRYQEAALAHLDGDDDRAEALAFDAYRIFSPVSEARAASALHGQILGIRLTQNRTSELADTLRAMIAGQPSVPAWHAALGHATALTDRSESRTHLELALDRAHRDFTWLATHVVGARATVLLGDHRLARRYLDALAPYSGLSCWQGTCTYGPVDTALAQTAVLCDDERAIEFTINARRVAEKLNSPHYQAEAAQTQA